MNIQKLIEENNKIYNNSSKEEKRLLVLNDLLSQLNKGVYTGSSGRILVGNGYYYSNIIPNQEFLLDNMPECEVCIKGSLILSKQRMGNNVPTGRVRNNSRFLMMQDIYSKTELDILEIFFENTISFTWLTKGSLKATEGIRNYYIKFNDSNERLKAIISDLLEVKGDVLKLCKNIREKVK